MNKEKAKDRSILFDLGNGKYRKATAEEIASGRIPVETESVIYLEDTGAHSRRFVDPLGR